MNFEELQQHIRYLESFEEADAPAVSCYLGVKTPYRNGFNEQVRSITAGLPMEMRASFWEILGRIEVFLGTSLQTGTKGAAIFARWGDQPLFLPLQFDVPFPNMIAMRPAPQIGPLIALRDEMVCLAANRSGMEISSAFIT